MWEGTTPLTEGRVWEGKGNLEFSSKKFRVLCIFIAKIRLYLWPETGTGGLTHTGLTI